MKHLATAIGIIILTPNILAFAQPASAKQNRVTVEGDGDVVVEREGQPDRPAGHVGMHSVGENHEHRRFHIAVGAGLSGFTEDGRVRPQFEESIAYRFTDHDRGGLFAGIVFGQSFDSRANIGTTLLQFALRLGAEIPFYANGDLHFYAVPFLQAGFAHTILSGPLFSRNDSQLLFGMGGELRMSFADDFVAVFVRPLHFNFVHYDAFARFLPEYQFLGGVALRF